MAIGMNKYESSREFNLHFRKEAEKYNCHEEIKKRLKLPKNPEAMRTPLSNYFFLEEQHDVYEGGSVRLMDVNRKRNILVESDLENLTLKVSVSSLEDIPPGELFNVKKLDSFILTGEYSKD